MKKINIAILLMLLLFSSKCIIAQDIDAEATRARQKKLEQDVESQTSNEQKVKLIVENMRVRIKEFNDWNPASRKDIDKQTLGDLIISNKRNIETLKAGEEAIKTKNYEGIISAIARQNKTSDSLAVHGSEWTRARTKFVNKN